MSTNYSNQWWDQIFTQSFGKSYAAAAERLPYLPGIGFYKYAYWEDQYQKAKKRCWKKVTRGGWYKENGKKYVDAIDGTVEYDPTYSVIMEDEQGWRHVVRR